MGAAPVVDGSNHQEGEMNEYYDKLVSEIGRTGANAIIGAAMGVAVALALCVVLGLGFLVFVYLGWFAGMLYVAALAGAVGGAALDLGP